jgi:hypothetical protein
MSTNTLDDWHKQTSHKTPHKMELHSMRVAPNIIDFVVKHDVKADDGISILFLGNVALAVLACVAVGFAFWPRKFGDFPIVRKYEDLYGGLVEGTNMVRISMYSRSEDEGRQMYMI